MPQTVSRVCTDHCRGVRQLRRSSNSTGNPRPPAMTATRSGGRSTASSTKPIRLSVYSAKPALLNAETAWKTPCQSGLGPGSS